VHSPVDEVRVLEKSIALTDWKRLLVGEAPFAFLGEVLLRALIVYLFLLVALRLMASAWAARFRTSSWA
jgi:hypothetical protein